MKVTTRYQNRQKIRADNKEIELPTQSIEKASKPNVCVVINNDKVRKVVSKSERGRGRVHVRAQRETERARCERESMRC